jgi:hypothetical protein
MLFGELNRKRLEKIYTIKKGIFSSSAGVSLTKLSLAGNVKKIFPFRESLVSDIPAGDEKIVNFFIGVVLAIEQFPYKNAVC